MLLVDASLYLNMFLGFALLLLFLMLDKEGRHHLYMKFKKGGFSFISMEPGGSLNLRRLRFNGDYFECGNEAIYMGFDMLLNPETDEAKLYNKTMNLPTFWAGSRIPVAMGFEATSFVANPNIIHKIEEAKNHPDYDKVKLVLENLAKVLGEKIVKVSIVQPFSISTIREYLNTGITATKQREAYEKGKISGILQMTKSRDLGGIAKFAIPLGLILVIVILWQTGFFDQFLGRIPQ